MLNNSAPSGDAPPASSAPVPIAARLRAFQIADAERRGGRPRSRRRWLWLLVLAVHVAAGWIVYTHLAPKELVEVETYTFTGKAPREVLLDLTGFIVPRTRIVISTQVGGIVSKVHLPREGQKVKSGALLFEVEDTRYRAEYLQAQAALHTAQAQLLELTNGARPQEKKQASARLEQARAQASLMETELTRVRRLVAENAAGRAELEKVYKAHVEAQASLRSERANAELVEQGPRRERIAAAQAEVDRARAVYERARFYFEKTKVYAPADGSTTFTLLEKRVAVGESIQADLTYTPLCTLADLTQMEAEIDVPECDLGSLTIGGLCEIIPDAHPQRVYRGHIDRKQPIVNRQRGVVQVKVTIDSPDDHLLPDMNARVLLLRDTPRPSASDALPEVPVQALVPGSETPAVFVLDGQTARLRTIDIAEPIGKRVRVRSGLHVDDRIILAAGQPLTDGQLVTARGQNRSNDRRDHR